MKNLVIEGPNGPVSVAITGEGPPLLLAAGVGSTSRIWGGLPTVLGRHFTVVCPDNRGVGGSRNGLGFTLERAADDIATVLDHLGFSTASLFGASMGGAICLQTAIRHPARVARVAVASCAAHLSRHGKQMLDLLDTLARRLQPREFGHALMTLAFAPPFHEAHPELVEAVADLYGPDPADMPGILDALACLRGGLDFRPQLATITAPVLVLAGERDAIVAREDTEEIAEAIPVSTFHIVPGAGHSVLAEGGTGLLDLLISFFLAPRPT
ncbi:MAG: alpha/beta fold hydrolase [Acidobacteria bacterium]|nr:alpha/beta fold hydrolase [Acidobacteriota bacterium]